MTLAEAQAAHQAAAMALEQAKGVYFETPGPKAKAGIAKAEAELADARLELERAEHAESMARSARAAADREARTVALADLKATDANRQAAIGDAILELVNLERSAHALVDEIARLTAARQNAFQQRKQLALSLDRDAIEKAPPSIGEARIELAVEIRRARIADGRDAGDTDMVSTWLQPAVRVYPKVALAK